MAHFNWRAAALVALTSLAFAAYAVAQETSSSSQEKSGSSQNSASSGQGQGQASDNNTKNSNSSNAQNENAQSSRDAKSSQDQPQQDRPNQNRDDRSSTNSASERNSSSNSRARDDRDSARSDRDDRAGTRDRSSRDADRNVDSRSSNLDRDSSREHTSRRDNMRGPDIGIWFSRSSRDGLVISDVSSKGAIAKLGFREGDRIVSVNGRRVTREDEFLQFLLHGDARRATVIVLRNNREETIYVEPAVLIDDRDYVEVDPLERFGIIVDDRYDDRIVVWRVIPRSPAYYAGFHPGDVIVTFGDRPYRTRTEFERGSRDWKAGDVNVQVRRGDRTRDLSVEIPNIVRVDRRNERIERRDERTAQRNSSLTPDQGNANQTDRNTNDSRNDNRRGGLLDRVRGNR